MLWVSVTLLALFASAQGRAVNISNTWVLPEEGFPVFYRYFRDRISWYEADAVCQFHHANLVTVDTTAQYDAVRAYLKELDISSAVWVGLIRSNPDGEFTWTDYRGLSSEGYWSSAPDARAAPLCAAADPVADYRWEARACGGPTVASFICELPVPQWALGNDGCMVRALPALTVLYLPESAAVQLTADCGLAGVKRVQCTGNVKREELLKELSCNDEEDISSTLSLASTSAVWSATDTPTTDQESTSDEQSAEDTIVTEYKETSNTQTHITETSTPYNLNIASEIRNPTTQTFNTNDNVRKPLNEHLNLEINNNIISNDILHQDNSINNQNLEKIEDNKQIKHRLLHDEITRLGNLETIFTQPTDHFVPPLVMAKARISDDMTVLSLKEKYAQQIAEQQLFKHNSFEKHLNVMASQISNRDSKAANNIVTPTKVVQHDEKLTMSVQSFQNGNSVKKEMKSSVPKKYIDKYDIKGKIWKTLDAKLAKSEKKDELSTSEASRTTNKIETTTIKIQPESEEDSEEDSIIDLTVIIKEPGVENSQTIFYSNHSDSVPKIILTKNTTDGNEKDADINYLTSEKPRITTNPTTEDQTQASTKVTLNHEIIKITVIDHNNNETSTPIVFEISTMAPVLSNGSVEIKNTHSSSTTTGHTLSQNSSSHTAASSFVTEMSTAGVQTVQLYPVTLLNNYENVASEPSTTNNNTVKTMEDIVISTKTLVTIPQITTDAVSVTTTTTSIDEHISEKSHETETTTTANNSLNLTEVTMIEKADVFNHTDHNEEEQEQHESDVIDDYQSPLLSAANEPLHRPGRSRRPQPLPNRLNKFNPFRILG